MSDALEKVVCECFALAESCGETERKLRTGEVSLDDYVVACFMLVYAGVKCGFEDEPESRVAADVVAHNCRTLVSNLTKTKARLLELEGGEPKTANGRLVIEARWREAINWLVDEYGDSVLVDTVRGEDFLPQELEADFFS